MLEKEEEYKSHRETARHALEEMEVYKRKEVSCPTLSFYKYLNYMRLRWCYLLMLNVQVILAFGLCLSQVSRVSEARRLTSVACMIFSLE